MARRKVSILRERKMKLSAQVEILEEIKEIIKFKTQDSEKKFLDKKLRLEIRLEEVDELLEEEMMSKMVSPSDLPEKGVELKGSNSISFADNQNQSEVPDKLTNKELFNILNKGLTQSEKDSDDEELSDSRGIGDH